MSKSLSLWHTDMTVDEQIIMIDGRDQDGLRKVHPYDAKARAAPWSLLFFCLSNMIKSIRITALHAQTRLQTGI
jgi:hypothetical protein